MMWVVVLALPHLTPLLLIIQLQCKKPVSLTNGEPTTSPSGSTHTHTSSHTQDLESPTQNEEHPTQKLESQLQNLESLRQTLSALRLKQERVRHHTKFLNLHTDQKSFPKGIEITLPVQVPDYENSNLQRELFSLQTEIGKLKTKLGRNERRKPQETMFKH